MANVEDVPRQPLLPPVGERQPSHISEDGEDRDLPFEPSARSRNSSGREAGKGVRVPYRLRLSRPRFPAVRSVLLPTG